MIKFHISTALFIVYYVNPMSSAYEIQSIRMTLIDRQKSHFFVHQNTIRSEIQVIIRES